jgi:hypothetical protein
MRLEGRYLGLGLDQQHGMCDPEIVCMEEEMCVTHERADSHHVDSDDGLMGANWLGSI